MMKKTGDLKAALAAGTYDRAQVTELKGVEDVLGGGVPGPKRPGGVMFKHVGPGPASPRAGPDNHPCSRHPVEHILRGRVEEVLTVYE